MNRKLFYLFQKLSYTGFQNRLKKRKLLSFSSLYSLTSEVNN